MRVIAVITLLTLVGCAGAPSGPPAQASSTNVNPITGQRGGSSANR